MRSSTSCISNLGLRLFKKSYPIISTRHIPTRKNYYYYINNFTLKHLLSTSSSEDLKNLRQQLVKLCKSRKDIQLSSILVDFASNDVPYMSEAELEQLEDILNLSDQYILKLINYPGETKDRPHFIQDNMVLNRLVSFARFRNGAAEFS